MLELLKSAQYMTRHEHGGWYVIKLGVPGPQPPGTWCIAYASPDWGKWADGKHAAWQPDLERAELWR